MSFIPYFDKSKAVEIELDKKRLLYFTIGDAAELEKALDASLYQAISSQRYLSSQQFVQEALAIGLGADERGITKQRVEEILGGVLSECYGEDHAKALLGISAKIIEALKNCGALPKDKPKKDEKEGTSAGKSKTKEKE